MGIFAANAIFSLLLFIWIINSGLNESAQSWSTYLKNRIEFLSEAITTTSTTNYGFTTVFKIQLNGKVFERDQEKISLKNIYGSELYERIKDTKIGESKLIQFRNILDPALKAVYLIKRTTHSYIIGLLAPKSLLPTIPKTQQIILFNEHGGIEYSTFNKHKIPFSSLNHGIVFYNGHAFAIEHSRSSEPDMFDMALIKDVSKEFYGLTILIILTTITLGTGLIRSRKISEDLLLVESEFRKINSLLSGITISDKSQTVPIIMKDTAEELKSIDWDNLAESTVFQENRMYLNSMTFFARNMVHLLDAVSQHSRALTISEEKYRDLVNRANSIILRMNRNGNITFFNEFAQTFFGYTQQEIIGKNIFDTIVPVINPGGEDLRKKLVELFKDPENLPTSNNENIRKDGSRVWIQWTNSPVYNEDGEVAEILCVGMDITDRRKAVLELSKANNRIKDIIDSMPSVVISVDSILRVNHFNLSAGQMSSMDINDIKDAPVERAFPILTEFRDKLEMALITGVPDTENIVTSSDKGLIKYVDVMIYPLTGSYEQGAVIRIDDVTERVRLEEIMIQTEKMMSVGGLAAGMAHEINNPLGGILQGIQNIIRRFSPDLKPNVDAAKKAGCDLDAVLQYMELRKITSMLNGITESGIRAADIVSGMLEFSRRSDSRKAPGKLDVLLDNTINLAAKDYDLKKRYDFKQIEIVRNYDSDVPPVLCSNTEIEQVFLNLLRNSAQAMSDWEKMEEKPRIEVSISKCQNMVCCEIKDNGPGMDAETRKRVFEPFFTTKDPGVGTGLGLSVSYFIITKNHNGIFEVHSKVGEGTSFTIMLPEAPSY
jgi:PAS domain S-box-containing protein